MPILILLLIIVSCPLKAQENPPVPAHWNGINFAAFSDSILKNNRIRIYYRAQHLEDHLIEAGDDTSLDDVLDQILDGKNLTYHRTSNSGIYILPVDFFEGAPDQIFFSGKDRGGETDYTVSLEPEVEEEVDKKPVKKEDLYKRVVNVGKLSKNMRNGSAVISGKVSDEDTGEPIVGATVFIEELQAGAVTNVSGNYFLKVPEGTYKLGARFVGKKEIFLTVNVLSDGELDLEMEDKAMELKAVVVTANKYNNVQSTQMGVNRIDTRMMGSIPAIGEVDVLKVSMLLPGVQSVGEGTTGFNVRGGNTDQNLILLDDAPIFNPSHLMGFFSAFNAEVIRDFELHKSVIPPKMGGRLASVMELNVKNGNKKNFSGSAGISPLTGKFHLEGPILKEKFSFLVGGRSTYSNWLLKRIDNEEIKRSQAAFYDMNAKLDYDINNKHNLSLSGYYSHDDFYKNDGDTLFLYTNSSASLKWRYKINPSLIKNTRLIYSNYNNSISDISSLEDAYKVSYNIDYYEYKSDFIYFLNNKHLLNFGLSLNYYQLLPGKLEPIREESAVIPRTIENEQGSELAFYISDEFRLSSDLTINAGLRYSFYSYLGPGKIFKYNENLPMDISTLRDTVHFEGFSSIENYHGPEPRISMRYILADELSLKLGYSRMRQNVHIMSNTFSVSPTDTWKLSDPNLIPQIADQYSLGIYKNFKGGMIEASVETYYKNISGLKDYKVAATLLMNEHVETEIINCEGKAYGAELLIRKPSGKLNGWLSYTYSRILQRSQGRFREEKINNNEWFPAIYDKPHSFSLVGNYRFSRRVSMSTNVVYSTGRPITYPVAKYNFRNGRFLHYSNRNEYRVDDYFRWDMSFNLDGNLRTDQITHSFWSLSVYNITGRDNVYSIYFVSGGESVQGYKMSVFAEPILSISYNIRF
jgi:hypothetical protein